MPGKVVKKRVAFRYHAPDAGAVFVSGSFNGWNTGANPLKKNREGQWTVVVALFPGTYEYRFLVDGKWKDDPNCGRRHLNRYGGYNDVLTVD